MYAVIETGGKQYRVQPGDVIKVEKLNVEAGQEIKFDKVLVMGEGSDAKVGTPYLDAAITGKVVENGRGKKVIIYKYKAKKDYRKKQGHRQPFTMVEIIEVGGVKAEPKAEPAKKEAAPEEEPATETVEETVVEEAVAEETAAETEDKGVSMSMKKDELIAYAKEHGIEINEKATKQEIIDTIQEVK